MAMPERLEDISAWLGMPPNIQIVKIESEDWLSVLTITYIAPPGGPYGMRRFAQDGVYVTLIAEIPARPIPERWFDMPPREQFIY